jgi:DNA-directed RNA polymerase specialized sigma24 family protein
VPNPPSLAADWPPADALLGAWRRLVEDPDAAAEFAALVLPPLAAGLADRNRRAHPDDLATAAGDAVLAFLKRPGAYDPGRLPLANYLLLIAKRRLLNQAQAEGRHHAGRIPWDCVELDAVARNSPGGEFAGRLDGPELSAVVDQFSDGERRVWQLMRGGERRTEAFAEVLGVAGDPDREAHVKRAKDRIKARLKRAAGGDDG